MAEDTGRVQFTELYEYVIYIAWILGIFLGIHAEQINKYSPPGANEVAPAPLIASHAHLLLMTLLLYFMVRMFRNTLETRKWPYYWTELMLVSSLVGAYLYSITKYCEAAIEYGGQIQLISFVEKMSYGNIEISSTLYLLGIMGFLVMAMISRIMR
ncbi:hypothetical protein KKA03_00105 [archaeon]|nr:hypothetical protein [archaeon]